MYFGRVIVRILHERTIMDSIKRNAWYSIKLDAIGNPEEIFETVNLFEMDCLATSLLMQKRPDSVIYSINRWKQSPKSTMWASLSVLWAEYQRPPLRLPDYV